VLTRGPLLGLYCVTFSARLPHLVSPFISHLAVTARPPFGSMTGRRSNTKSSRFIIRQVIEGLGSVGRFKSRYPRKWIGIMEAMKTMVNSRYWRIIYRSDDFSLIRLTNPELVLTIQKFRFKLRPTQLLRGRPRTSFSPTSSATKYYLESYNNTSTGIGIPTLSPT